MDDFTCFSFNTQPPEGGCQHAADKVNSPVLFQHTATRRWLPHHTFVSIAILNCFNTQPPEGGCALSRGDMKVLSGFNTQPPEGGCAKT